MYAWLKVHLILHLMESIVQFGPASCFSTERFEAFNSLMRSQNVYGNRHAPSKDISHNFAILEHLRFICSGGLYDQDQQAANHLVMTSYGKGLEDLYKNLEVQKFINHVSTNDFVEDKAIYQPGCLCKLKKGTPPCKLSELELHFCYEKSNFTLFDAVNASGLILHYIHQVSLHSCVIHHGACSYVFCKDFSEQWRFRLC